MQDGGYYYLDWTGEVAKKLEVPDNATVHLCLNGARVKAQSTIVTGENSKIVICDCTNAGTVTTTGSNPVVVDQNATVILMSGIINGSNGTTASRISVVVAEGGTFEMYGGAVKDGCAALDKITDTSKKEGTSAGGNITVRGTARFMGGTVSGGKYNGNRDVTAYSTAKITVGGKAKIGYMMLVGIKIAVEEKDLDAAVGITSTKATEAFATTSADVSGCFTSAHASYNTVGWVNGDLVLGNKADHQHCFCTGAEARIEGHKCNTLTAWTPVEKEEKANTELQDGGYYYLDWTGESAQSLTVPAGAEVHLCLNGATIYAAKALTINAGATVHICDCSAKQTGKIAASGQSTEAVFYLNKTTIVNLYSGSLTGEHGKTAEKKVRTVYLAGDTARFNMYGGKLYGGYATGSGGNVIISGADNVFTLNGGTITGGTVASGKHGGNVFMTKGNFVMNGGTITAGVTNAKGGNVALVPSNTDGGCHPAFTMNGGTISGGLSSGTNAANGGNIAINAVKEGNSATFLMNGGTVTGGTATTAGGNFYVYSDLDTLTINGGTVTGGTAATGPCIYNNGSTKVTVGADAAVDSVTNK